MTIRGLIFLVAGIVLVGIIGCTVLGVLFLPKLLNSQVVYTCADGHTQNTPCSSGQNPPTSPATDILPTPTQPPNNPGAAIVTTSDQPCPTTDFSLKQGVATCNFPGGKTLICEGDLNDSLGTTHDSDPTTGQVDIIDQAATIDGRDNGGTCHYSPPWTENMSISSVRHGCGGGCASVQVWHDGKLEKTV